MKLADYPQSIQNALGLHEIMRKLGVPSEDIFVNAEDGQLFLVLGNASFAVGPAPEDIEALWKAAANCWNSGPVDAQQVFESFKNRVDTIRLGAAIQQAWVEVQALRASDFGPCPSCGLKLTMSRLPDGSPSAITHLEPMCSAFDGRSAEEFLRYVLDERAKLRNVSPEA